MSTGTDNRDIARFTTALPKKQYLSLKHATIAYREYGEGAPVFLLHGMNGESGSWLHQLRGLSTHYRVIAWDAPGYGGSESVGDTIASLSDAAFRLMEALHVDKPVLVGHSMGGVIAGHLATTRPESLSALVLSCSHWGYGRPRGEELLPRYSTRIEELKTMSRDDFVRLRASRMVAGDTDPAVLAFLAEMCYAVTVEALEQVGRANQEADNRPGLARLTLPLYLLYAEHDLVIRQTCTDELIRSVPAAKVIRLNGVGHAPYIEDASSYNRILRSILAEVWPDTQPNPRP